MGSKDPRQKGHMNISFQKGTINSIQQVVALRACAIILLAAIPLVTPRTGFAQGDPSVVGQWARVDPWLGHGIHSHLLPNGSVLHHFTGNYNGPRVWNPITGSSGPFTT